MLARIIACVGVLALLFVTPVAARDVPGGWQGALTRPNGGQLRLPFHFEKAAESRYTGTMDSPDQGVSDIPLAAVTSAGAELAFDVPSLKGDFRGKWDGTGWNGEWAQGA